MYDYVFLDFEAAPAERPAAAFATEIRGLKGRISSGGGEALGLFTPQLGWRAGQAALLVAWRPEATGREDMMGAIASTSGVARSAHHRLVPTARPAEGAIPKPGGVYVHRWFVIDEPNLDEFVQLSTQGWVDFESKFDTDIFGLFKVEPTDAEKAQGRIRMLLITRYADHGVWETSRDPSTEAMAAFMRRQRLTHDTWAASTLLTPL